MTTPATEAKAGPYDGNDSASVFAFDFPVYADSDIRVIETLISTEAETDLVLNGANGYTVVRNIDQDNNPGGEITYKQASVTTALPSTKKLTIVPDFAFEQPTDIPNGGSFFASIIERAFDRVTMLVKQLKEQVDRSVKVPVSSDIDPDDLVAGLVAASDAAVAAYDAFDDRYLGAKASDPATDNDGGALLEGAIYWNTTTKAMRAFDGTQWRELLTAAFQVSVFSGDDVETEFALPTSPISKNNVDVYISGVYQQKSTYSVLGTTLTFVTAPPAGTDNVEIVLAQLLPVASADSANVTYTPAGTGAVQTSLQSKLRERISVWDFIPLIYHGQIATGTLTDDISAYLQAAVDHAATVVDSSIQLNYYGVGVYFPPGSYNLGANEITVTEHGIGFYGDPGKGTKITGSGILFNVGDYTDTRRVYRTHFQHLNLVSSDAASATAAVKLYRTTGTVFENVQFISFGIGIDSYRSSETRVTGCRFVNSSRTAQATAFLRLQGTDETVSTGSTYTPGGGWHVTDNEFIGASQVASFDTTSGVLLMSVDGFYMTQCHFMGCGTSLDIAPDATAENHTIADIMAVNNYFDEPSALSTTRNMQIRGTVKESITMADASTQYSTYQSIRMVNNYFRGSSYATRNIFVSVTDGDSWYDFGTRRLKDLIFTGNTIRQSLVCGIEIQGASTSRVEPYGVVINGNYFEEHNSSSTAGIGAAITANCESITANSNTVGAHSGTSDYSLLLNVLDAGNDAAEPSAVAIGNNCSKAPVSIESVRIPQGATSLGANSVQADNVYPGAGRVVDQAYKLTTTNATTGTAWDFVIPEGAAGFVRATVMGSNATGSKAVAYVFESGFRRNSGGSSLSSGGASFVTVRAWNPDAIATIPAADLSANTLRVQVTGVAAETWTWVVHIQLDACK
jgi:hypothetical protein